MLKRIEVRKGSRLEALLTATPPKSDTEIVKELFLATISRIPTQHEEEVALNLLKGDRQRGAEDLLWALINRIDFIFST